MSPGLARTRSPLRPTATTAALNCSRKRRSRTVMPARGRGGWGGVWEGCNALGFVRFVRFVCVCVCGFLGGSFLSITISEVQRRGAPCQRPPSSPAPPSHARPAERDTSRTRPAPASGEPGATMACTRRRSMVCVSVSLLACGVWGGTRSGKFRAVQAQEGGRHPAAKRGTPPHPSPTPGANWQAVVERSGAELQAHGPHACPRVMQTSSSGMLCTQCTHLSVCQRLQAGGVADESDRRGVACVCVCGGGGGGVGGGASQRRMRAQWVGRVEAAARGTALTCQVAPCFTPTHARQS